jgi:hypothetical protein
MPPLLFESGGFYFPNEFLASRRVPRRIPFSSGRFCGILFRMGNKDKGRKETKKAPKPKPKPEPGRKQEILATPPK